MVPHSSYSAPSWSVEDLCTGVVRRCGTGKGFRFRAKCMRGVTSGGKGTTYERHSSSRSYLVWLHTYDKLGGTRLKFNIFFGVGLCCLTGRG